MNPAQRECIVCGESERSFILTVRNNGVSRRLCTDCLLKEHRELFCSICLNTFDAVPPPQARIKCLNCPAIIHLSCSPHPPPSSSAASSSSVAPPASSFTCPPCSIPNFSFFPKSSRDNEDVPETPLNADSAMALIAAAKISGDSMFKAVKHLKQEVVNKVVAARVAKVKAKDALENLQLLVLRQKASESKTPNSNKRKIDDR
ncbi:hypothetical protein V5N11_018787 [Cardamine amara subsp. amara]|uniref:Uncharacterized protein n=1 Tax=Cardamine amara subsp. amara TaxID=228776 RepID=A0ABD1A7E2_CARAN